MTLLELAAALGALTPNLGVNVPVVFLLEDGTRLDVHEVRLAPPSPGFDAGEVQISLRAAV